MTSERSIGKRRWIGVGLILFLAWLALTLGVLGVYLHRSVYNSDAFASRVAAVISQPDVQTAVATQLTTSIIEKLPKAALARPLIQSVAETIVAEPAFKSLLVTALVHVHDVLLDPTTAPIVFKIEGAAQMIEQALAVLDVKIAKEVGAAAAAEIAKIPAPGPAFRLIQLGADLGPFAWGVGVLGLLLGVVAALIAPDRRRGAVTALVVLGFTGFGLIFILGLAVVALTAATANQPVLSLALGGAFDGLFGDLRRVSYWIAAVGVIAAVVMWSLRYTLPAAGSVTARAREGAAGAFVVAGAKVGGALHAAADSAGATSATASVGSETTTAAVGTAVEKPAGGTIQAQDMMLAVRGGVMRLLVPAESNSGRLLQGGVALVIGLAILFAWSTVISVLIFALGLGLLALALNRVLIVIFAYRANRALESANQLTVGAGSSTDASSTDA